jgi:hypothetical protein
MQVRKLVFKPVLHDQIVYDRLQNFAHVSSGRGNPGTLQQFHDVDFCFVCPLPLLFERRPIVLIRFVLYSRAALDQNSPKFLLLLSRQNAIAPQMRPRFESRPSGGHRFAY